MDIRRAVEITPGTERFLRGMGLRIASAPGDVPTVYVPTPAKVAWDKMSHAERQFWRGRFVGAAFDSFDCCADFAYANRCAMPGCPNQATHAPTQGNGGSDAYLCDECFLEGGGDSEGWAARRREIRNMDTANPTASWRTILREVRATEGRDTARVIFACALYWFCAENHDGQWSRRYSVLSRIGYQPGASERGVDQGTPEEEMCASFVDCNALA